MKDKTEWAKDIEGTISDLMDDIAELQDTTDFLRDKIRLLEENQKA